MDYDAVAEEYDARRRGPRWELYDEVTRAAVEPLLPAPGGAVLDAGAGTGRWSTFFAERGLRVAALDPSSAMLEVARRKLEAAGASGASFHQGSIERLAFPDATFDLVFCEGDPLSYVADPAEAAAELVRVLKPGGALYASADARVLGALAFLARGDAERAAAALIHGRSLDPYGAPVHAFAPEEFAALFERAGAREVRVGAKIALANFLSEERLASFRADPAAWKRLVDLETRLAFDPSVAGFGGHVHAVGRKP